MNFSNPNKKQQPLTSSSDNEDKNKGKEKTFVSLKWKYGFIISFVLLILYTSISFTLYYKAKTLYNEQLQYQTNELFSTLDDFIIHSS